MKGRSLLRVQGTDGKCRYHHALKIKAEQEGNIITVPSEPSNWAAFHRSGFSSDPRPSPPGDSTRLSSCWRLATIESEIIVSEEESRERICPSPSTGQTILMVCVCISLLETQEPEKWQELGTAVQNQPCALRVNTITGGFPPVPCSVTFSTHSWPQGLFHAVCYCYKSWQ